jgi:hypothetical protein
LPNLVIGFAIFTGAVVYIFKGKKQQAIDQENDEL